MTPDWIIPLWLESFQETLLQTSIEASLFMLIVFALRFLMKPWLTPRICYLLCILALIRFMLPMAPIRVDSILGKTELPSNMETAQSIPAMPMDLPRFSLEPTGTEVPDSVQVPWVNETRVSESHPFLQLLKNLVWSSLLPICLWVALYHYRRWRHFHQWMQSTVMLDPTSAPDVFNILVGLCRELNMRKIPRLRISSLTVPPMLSGWLHPTIILPRTLLDSSQPETFRAILLHELNHWKSMDPWVNTLTILMISLHWFNPMMWLLTVDLRRRQEIACDAEVLGRIEKAEMKGYAQLLLKTAGLSLKPEALQSRVVSSFHSELTRRIEAMTRFRLPNSMQRHVGILLLLVSSGLAMVGSANQQKEEEPESASESITESDPSDPELMRLGKEWLQLEGKIIGISNEINRIKKRIEALKKEEIDSGEDDPYRTLIMTERQSRVSELSRRYLTLRRQQMEILGNANFSAEQIIQQAESLKDIEYERTEPLRQKVINSQYIDVTEYLKSEIADLSWEKNMEIRKLQSKLDELQTKGETLRYEILKLRLEGLRRIRDAILLRLNQLMDETDLKTGIEVIEFELEKQNLLVAQVELELAEAQKTYQGRDFIPGVEELITGIRSKLKTEKRIRDAIQLRLIQEKVDSSMPKSSQ